jgi:hypothetical protein
MMLGDTPVGDNIEIGKDGTFNGPVNVHHGPVPTATAALPPAPIGFTGRDAELARLLPSLDPAGGASAIPVLIFAVTGMGGIGKTALALHAAHTTVAKGWFPGGTLFVDLRGYDDNPVTADQAVLALLDALGVRGRDLPQTATAQLDLYRTLLAHQRRHMLLILDNASSPTQFTPFFPASAITASSSPPATAPTLFPSGSSTSKPLRRRTQSPSSRTPFTKRTNATTARLANPMPSPTSPPSAATFRSLSRSRRRCCAGAATATSPRLSPTSARQVTPRMP